MIESNLEKAAVLLRALGEENAAQVLKHIGVSDVEKVSEKIMGLGSVTYQDAEEVLQAFQQSVAEQSSLNISTDEYVRRMVEDALDPDHARGLLKRLLGDTEIGMNELQWMDERGIVELLADEHPQTIALALNSISHSKAAKIISQFTDDLASDVIVRIARLEEVQPTALARMKQTLLDKSKNSATQAGGSSKLDGRKMAVQILKDLDTDLQGALQERITEADEELGRKIEELMFTFENLIDADDRGIQALLREIDSDKLLIALRGASEKVKNKILNNISKRAATLLQDDLETMAPVKLSEVEEAQKEIAAMALSMAEDGKIVLATSGGDYV